MTIGSRTRLGFVAVVAGLVLWAGCGGDKKEKTVTQPLNDSLQIQAVLDETAARWRKKDVAVLYDQEFEYFQDKISFDEYLAQELIQRMEADSLEALTATKVLTFGHDSARVSIDAYLRGVTGQEYHYPDEFTMYYHRNRWIRPTMSNIVQQREYDSLKRVADSAAQAEDQDTTGV